MQHIILLSSLEEADWACDRVPADAQWTPLEAWPRGTSLPLDGLGLSLGWDEVYAGVAQRVSRSTSMNSCSDWIRRY